MGRAHPHSRGENRSRRERKPATTGSSPLTRGKRSTSRSQHSGSGLIPTHAGKTLRSRRAWGRRWAHPHSRGENPKTLSDSLLDPGSSPLTRGKRTQGHVNQVTVGLIPTHAGKTCPFCSLLSLYWAHPHSRGENKNHQKPMRLTHGSSPLTRGKLHLAALTCADARLIPTHAGKTPEPSPAGTGGGAHPHSRGENAGAWAV